MLLIGITLLVNCYSEAIGLSSKSNKNLEKITHMLNDLEKLEYIEINRDGRTNSYRILPYKK